MGAGTGAAFVRSRQQVSASVGVEEVVLNAEAGSYHALAGSGTRIWQLLAEPVTVDEICAVLQREYEVDEAECAGEVASFLAELQARGLIEPVVQ